MALAHPFHPIKNKSMNKRWSLWVGRCVSSGWPLFLSRNYVLIYIYPYVCIYTSSGNRTCVYVHRESRSVLVKLHPIAVWLLGVRCSCVESGSALFLCRKPPVVFFGFTNCVLLYDCKTRKLVTTGMRLNNISTLGILSSAIPHLPGCVVPSFRKSDSAWYYLTALCHI